MKTVSLKLNEVLNLEVELAGLINQSTGEQVIPGILSLELDFVLKYHLSKLHTQVLEEKKVIEKFREDLIKKFGEEDKDGNFSVPYVINLHKNDKGEVVSADPNPKFEEFSKEFEKFLQETVEVKVKEFTIADFEGIKLKTTPTVLFSLLDEEVEAKV